jgi:hypothetical protein
MSEARDGAARADFPIVCTLGDSARRERQDLLHRLADSAAVHTEISNGARFEFTPSSGILQAIVQTLDAERQCCRFLRFQLTVPPGGGLISLDVTGPPGTREFLRELLGS